MAYLGPQIVSFHSRPVFTFVFVPFADVVADHGGSTELDGVSVVGKAVHPGDYLCALLQVSGHTLNKQTEQKNR
jgi:hypothetical protein